MSAASFISRRRALQIVAGVTGATLLPGAAVQSAGASANVRWRGTVMNAPAKLHLLGDDEELARAALRNALAEARRQERIFSLYDNRSAICRLNRAGRLSAPPPELVEVLSEAHGISVATDGAFDVTMQPLWQLYAAHFARNPGDDAGPSEEARARICKLVDYRGISFSSKEVSFDRQGMAISLNGIAQGFVTDRVMGVLRSHGFKAMLVDLGEPRVMGSPRGKDAWPVAISDPESPDKVLRRLPLRDGAVATSQGAGTTFEPQGRHHHLFDPRTGVSAAYYRSVTVLAPTATRADGLSTALTILPPERLVTVCKQYPDAGVVAQLSNGDFLDVAT